MPFDKRVVEITNLDSEMFTYPGVYYSGSMDENSQYAHKPDKGGCSGCSNGGVNVACCCCPCCCCWSKG